MAEETRPKKRSERRKPPEAGSAKGNDEDFVMAGSLVEGGRAKVDEPKFKKMEGDKFGKYSRGVHAKPPKTKGKKSNRDALRNFHRNREAGQTLKMGEVLQTEESGYIVASKGEDTRTLTQADILEASTLGVAKKKFDFRLPYGPYCVEFTRNGQNILVGGRKGHVALLQTDTLQIDCEMHVKETVNAVQPCHNRQIYAVAQKKYVYMYDKNGVEIHCIKEHREPLHLDFLPYHFLLVASGQQAFLHYRDISTGQEVATHRTKMGPTSCMRQNPSNAVMHLGHDNGCVSLWTPSVKTPVVKLFTHNGKLTSLAVQGNYMVTAAADGFWKVWDLRKYEILRTSRTFGHSAADLDISGRGLLAIGFGIHLEVWDVLKQAQPKKPLLTEEFRGRPLQSLRFRPFEDVLGVGHAGGFETIIVPGAGVANFDSFEASPYETHKQSREREVHMLLDKLQPDSILLDPSRIGSLEPKIVKQFEEEQAAKEEEKRKAKERKKKKMRGKDKVGSRLKRKKQKEGTEQRDKARKRTAEGEPSSGADGSEDASEGDEGEEKQANVEVAEATAQSTPAVTGSALGRFFGKRRRKT